MRFYCELLLRSCYYGVIHLRLYAVVYAFIADYITIRYVVVYAFIADYITIRYDNVVRICLIIITVLFISSGSYCMFFVNIWFHICFLQINKETKQKLETTRGGEVKILMCLLLNAYAADMLH